MAREIVEVEETKSKEKKKKSLDFGKIAEVISENKDTIEKVAGVLLAAGAAKKATSKKKSTTKKKSTSAKKKTAAEENDPLASAMDIFGSLLKK